MGTFYFFLFQAHSGWRWVALLFLVVTTIKVVIGWAANQNWSNLDSRLVSFTNIAVSIQVLLGIFLYVMFLTQGAGITGRSIGAISGGHLVPALLAVAGTGFAVGRSRRAQNSRDKFKFASIGLIIADLMVYGALATVGGIFAMATS
ncbi:MAG TPA: hypothetical protein P5526_24460 [Anaerolineae bacterium]|nr:hypothetical protein [Anaerolineae bacterium]